MVNVDECRAVEGELKLDELITRRYSLAQINEAYEDIHEGKNPRGVIEFAHQVKGSTSWLEG